MEKMNKEIGLKRILKLADFVEKVPRKRFDFAYIVGDKWRSNKDLSCGTTACALGWATVMPLFRKLGLYINKDDRAVRLKAPDWDITDWSEMCGPLFGINEQAMQALFQPDIYEAEDTVELFGDYPTLGKDATPRQWARHARTMVEILRNE